MKRMLLVLTLLSLRCLTAHADVRLISASVTSGDIVNVVNENAASIYSTITDVTAASTNTVISPTSDVAVYRVTVGATNTDLSINTSNLTLAGRYATFEVEVLVTNALTSFTLPSTNVVTYVDGLPDVTTTVNGTRHYFVFRAGETGLICNKWWTRAP